MNERCKLNVVGITYSQIEKGVYAIILQEEGAHRRLPIVVGTSEAQSIECRLQKIKTPRPLTHDLMISCLSVYGVEIMEVFIRRLPNGVFTADLVLRDNDKTVVVDSRSSDAIALALRANAPIYTSRQVLDEAGFDAKEMMPKSSVASKKKTYEEMTMEELEDKMQTAVENEKYEDALEIKKEIDRRADNA